MVRVVAALLVQQGTLLAHQRPAHKVRGGLWELPGGKVEPGESETQALVRECHEELGASVDVGELFWRGTHAYQDTTVELAVYRVVQMSESPLLAHEGGALAWVHASEIANRQWSDADKPVVLAWVQEQLG